MCDSQSIKEITKEILADLQNNLSILNKKAENFDFSPSTSKKEFQRFSDLLLKTRMCSFIFEEDLIKEIKEIKEECEKIEEKYYRNLLESVTEYKNLQESAKNIPTTERNQFADKSIALLYEQLSLATENTGLIDDTNIGIEDLNIGHKDIKEKSDKLKDDLRKSNESRKTDAKNLFQAMVFGVVVLIFLFFYKIIKKMFSK